MKDLLSYDKDHHFIRVDDWIPDEKDIIFKQSKGYMTVPLIETFGLMNVNPNFDRFCLNSKKGYNKDKLRIHNAKYVNYFLKFYDTDKELLMIYFKLKTVMDTWATAYTEEAFLYDIKKYFLSMSMVYKIHRMNEDNYCVNISLKNSSVQDGCKYDNNHGRALLKLSLIMNLIIPLLTHFMYLKKIPDKVFLLKVYDVLLDCFDIDIYSKLYETSMSMISANMKDNTIWQKQDIRGMNPTIHAADSIDNILLNIIPKYVYCQNIVVMNFVSIKKNIDYKVTRPEYEYEFNPLSPIAEETSDEDSAGSQFDKFENTLTKENEGLYIQNKVNCEQTMKRLSYQYNINNEEIIFYIKQLMSNGKFLINHFQKELVFDLFYKSFGDIVSINAINRTDYVKLIIIAKRFLIQHNLKLLPYIIGGKITKLNERKDINSKQKKKMEGSELYGLVQQKYRNIKIEEYMRGIMGTILASEFSIIDYENPNLNGKEITPLEDCIIEEVLMFILII